MATDVTVAGTGGTPIHVSFTTAQNAAAAQTALNIINQLTGEQIITTTGIGVETVPATGNVQVNVTGSAPMTFLGALPDSTNLLVNTSSGFVIAEGGANTEVISSGSGTLFYYNTSANGQIFLGGQGGALISEASASAAAVVSLDGQAQIQGTIGSTTVNAYNGSFAHIVEGAGQVSVNAQAGSSVVYVDGSNPTTTVTVSGMAGSNITYVPGSGNAFINPGAGDVLVAMIGGSGSETLFGGAATIGGVAVSAQAFTGHATVFGGLGYFEGGSGGNNVLLSGTEAGATTLVGGGNGDILIGYAGQDVLMAGAGNETLIGGTGTPTLGSSTNTQAAGQFFYTGNGNAATMVYGDQSGADTIGLGSGAATIALGHQTVTGGISSVSGNTIMDQSGITTGSASLLGFASESYGWAAHDQILLGALSVTAIGNDANNNEVVKLSNGSQITFVGIDATSQYNVTTHGTAGNTYLS